MKINWKNWNWKNRHTLFPLKGSLSTVYSLNDKINMKYDISKTIVLKMPKLGRGLESAALLLSQVSKDMHQPIVPMLFPILGAHVMCILCIYISLKAGYFEINGVFLHKNYKRNTTCRYY